MHRWPPPGLPPDSPTKWGRDAKGWVENLSPAWRGSTGEAGEGATRSDHGPNFHRPHVAPSKRHRYFVGRVAYLSVIDNSFGRRSPAVPRRTTVASPSKGVGSALRISSGAPASCATSGTWAAG